MENCCFRSRTAPAQAALPHRRCEGCFLHSLQKLLHYERFRRRGCLLRLIRGQRSTPKRIEESFTTPTMRATPGDLSLVLPKRLLDGIIEMIYALDKIAPGTANDDTLLYGVEGKFYNMEVAVDETLQCCHKNLYIIGDGSGITHSLSHASASGVHVARNICKEA